MDFSVRYKAVFLTGFAEANLRTGCLVPFNNRSSLELTEIKAMQEKPGS